MIISPLCYPLIPHSKHGTVYIFSDFKFTFTTLGAVGSNGPTGTSGYKGTTLQGKIRIENGIQLWTVPLSGSYVIEAWGASGAEGRQSDKVSAVTRPGGKGAYVKGTFNLTRGKELKILVGQRGSRGKTGSPLPGGGGGGTFITSSADAPLIIAGGGGEVLRSQKISMKGIQARPHGMGHRQEALTDMGETFTKRAPRQLHLNVEREVA